MGFHAAYQGPSYLKLRMFLGLRLQNLIPPQYSQLGSTMPLPSSHRHGIGVELNLERPLLEGTAQTYPRLW